MEFRKRSDHSAAAAQGPFTDKAEQREQEKPGAVPERGLLHLDDRQIEFAEQGGETI